MELKELRQNYILKEKCYKINFDKIEEGYLSSGEFCHAETRGKAKCILWKKIEYEGWKCKYSFDQEITFLNLPIKRDKDGDIFEFEGNNVSIYKINEILVERERLKKLDDILNDDSIKYCYIRKGYYYKPNSRGYTEWRHKAGIYTKEESVSHAKSCSELSIIPIDIEAHNKILITEIEDIKTRIIKPC